jgi:crotonobetainyl-CoA:carnitine CoA-transferase CaiB-like acyl-CoA transferase
VSTAAVSESVEPRAEELPLEELTVVELTDNVAGPWAGRQFAALGAEVWKIEPPETGDVTRSLGPFLDENDRTESSVPWLYLNEGKRSVALEENAAGRDALAAALDQADILLVSRSATEAASLALDREALAAAHPALVATSVTPYGMTGPKRDYRGTELTEYAAGGLLYLTGEVDREPLQVGLPMAEFAAGQAAFAAAMAALLRRDARGRGAYIDLAITEVGAAMTEFQLSFLISRDYLATRLGNLNDKGYPWGIFPCRDGYAAILAGPANRWPQAATITGIPELADERFATAQSRQDHRDEMEAMLLPWLLDHDRKEIFELGQAEGLAWGYVRDAAEVADCPQLGSEGFFRTLEHPALGPVATADLPYTFSETATRSAPAPSLGADTEAFLEGPAGRNGSVR